MSKRHQQIKRLRYYRNSDSEQDRMADACGIELCKYTGECDFCDSPRSDARVWVQMSRGETVEANECVCSDCLPAYYRDAMAESNYWGTRECTRFWNQQERERVA